MQFDITHAIEILSRTPTVLNELLKDLPEDWTSSNEGDDTWSPFDVMGHLIHGENTDWIPRTEIILKGNPKNTFEPFDRFAQKLLSEGKSMNELLEEFKKLRGINLEKLASFELTEMELAMAGTHPELDKVTLKNLLSSWVVHDLGHIAQITRVMAKQYRSEIGPWHEYMTIIK